MEGVMDVLESISEIVKIYMGGETKVEPYFYIGPGLSVPTSAKILRALISPSF